VFAIPVSKSLEEVAGNMTEHRERMMSGFKTRFVPALRKPGFVGFFPHFRRLK
jgi:hypothetical protein